MTSEMSPQSPDPSSPERPSSLQEEIAETAQPATADVRAGTPPQPPVTLRELLAIGLLVVLADLTIYRNLGFAGCAAFFLLGPVLLWLGAPRPRLGKGLLLMVA
jgi:hypothetical protein